MSRRRLTLAIAFIALGIGTGLWLVMRRSSSPVEIRYGITPFQDSALPVVPAALGWYKESGLNVRLVDLGWEDVPLALASGSIDVALYNFDSFMSSWPSLASGGKDVVFYAPLYLWNGAAIMVRGGAMSPAGDLSVLSPAQRSERVRSAVGQLRGKRIGISEGTTFEQTVLDALRVAGMTRTDVVLVHAKAADNLAAFLSGGLDAFSAGLTERVQAQRSGAVPLVEGPDVSLPVVDGLVARRDFVELHPDEMARLVETWFRTVEYVSANPAERGRPVLNYLLGKASVDYSPEEYAVAWTFQYFPKSRDEAVRAFLTPGSPYFWRPIWAQNSLDLVQQGKIAKPVPERVFLGEEALRR
ncbi:MAG: ABC transporter substrate-binding protein [Gemmatimonadaceae bacterium]|nr:ABC transporter substrate-binding protein [Gemmatimonadaceae bacterium]